MNLFFKELKLVNTIEGAIKELEKQIDISPKLNEIIDFIIEAHEGQFRKSGEPYSVHPILVATITSTFSKDEDVIATALLHDVVEDTPFTLEFVEEKWGKNVSNMVKGLTKVADIREENFITSKDSSDTKIVQAALTFRKMLIASIDDPRVLIVKLCDRLHNMLTLAVLPQHKQRRIAEETLVVYVPIANRLGISTLKNELEDLAFFYIYPDEYKKIDDFLKENEQAMQLSFNTFIAITKNLLEKNGFEENEIKIYSRIKHHYSIYLKMQRKGITIEEVLDLFAIRILVPSDNSQPADESSTPATETSAPDTETTTTTTTTADSKPDETTTTTSAESGDSAKAVAAITAQIDGKVSSYEYRTEDAGFMYYYVFTEDGHGYSAAYNKADGSVVLVQSY